MQDEKKFRAVQDQAFELFKRKNSDYGSAFRKNGAVGMVIRLREKLDRFVTINQNSIVLSTDESMLDTLMDIHNCAALALLIMKESDNNDGI